MTGLESGYQRPQIEIKCGREKGGAAMLRAFMEAVQKEEVVGEVRSNDKEKKLKETIRDDSGVATVG